MGYFPAITGLRILAAALVFAHHYLHAMGGANSFTSIFEEGYLGVTIFFTLSGFLITRVYFDAFASRKVSFREYWLRRFARIYPVYFVILMIRLAFFRNDAGISGVAVNLTLTQSFFDKYLWSGLAPAWSLTVEECFYLAAPLLFYWLAKINSKTRSERVMRSGLLLAAISGALWIFGSGLHSLSLPMTFMGKMRTVELYTIFGRFSEFAVGVLLAIGLKKGGLKKAGPEKNRWANIAFVAGIAGLFASLGGLQWLTVHYKCWYGILSPLGVRSVWPGSIATALILWATVRDSPVAHRILGNRAFEYLGRISYVLYLLQDDRLFDAINGWAARLVGMPSGAKTPGFAAAFLIFLLIAAFLYEVIEKPAHRWLNQFAASKAALAGRAPTTVRLSHGKRRVPAVRARIRRAG